MTFLHRKRTLHKNVVKSSDKKKNLSNKPFPIMSLFSKNLLAGVRTPHAPNRTCVNNKKNRHHRWSNANQPQKSIKIFVVYLSWKRAVKFGLSSRLPWLQNQPLRFLISVPIFRRIQVVYWFTPYFVAENQLIYIFVPLNEWRRSGIKIDSLTGPSFF